MMTEELGISAKPLAEYLGRSISQLGRQDAPTIRSRQRRVWTVALVIAALMLLVPPWSYVGTRISAAGYGPLFVGPLKFDWVDYFGIDQSQHRLDIGRLVTQLAAIGAVAGVIDLMGHRKTATTPGVPK